MYRIAIERLLKWKESKRRKSLIIEGARQVGKTWLMKEFGNHVITSDAIILDKCQSWINLNEKIIGEMIKDCSCVEFGQAVD